MRCFMTLITRIVKWIKKLFTKKQPLSCGGNRDVARHWHLRVRLVDYSDYSYRCPICGSTEIYLISKQNISPMVKDVAYVICGKCFYFVSARSDTLACKKWLNHK